MVIEIHIDETGRGRSRQCPDEHDKYAYFDHDEDYTDSELDFFGIVVKNRGIPSCSYDENGYIPRSQRR